MWTQRITQLECSQLWLRLAIELLSARLSITFQSNAKETLAAVRNRKSRWNFQRFLLPYRFQEILLLPISLLFTAKITAGQSVVSWSGRWQSTYADISSYWRLACQRCSLCFISMAATSNDRREASASSPMCIDDQLLGLPLVDSGTQVYNWSDEQLEIIAEHRPVSYTHLTLPTIYSV